MLFVRDPILLKQLAIKEFDNFVDHRSIVNEDVDPMISKSLGVLTGQKWRGLLFKIVQSYQTFH